MCSVIPLICYMLMTQLKKISIPRPYFSMPWSECVATLELHAYGDASLKGYGAQTRDKSLKLCGGCLQAVEETSQRRECEIYAEDR